MTVVDVGQIRGGITERLDTIDGWRTVGYLPDQVEPPIFIVVPATPDFATRQTMEGDGGLWELTFQVIAIASRASERKAQEILDGVVSPTGTSSIRAAIGTDKTLGGLVDSCKYEQVSEYSLNAVINGVTYASATVDLTVRSRDT